MKLVLGRQNPTFSVVAVQLRADITYSKATVSVIIDERGLNKYARDYINEADELYLALTKGLISYQEAVDVISQIALSKRVLDEYVASDFVSIMVGFARSYVDSAGTSDSVNSFDITKRIIEAILSLDTLVYSLSKSLSDSVIVVDNADANSGDGLEYTEIKPSSDQIGASDLAVAAVFKQLSEAISLVEALTNILEKSITSVVSTAESVALGLDRPVDDSVTISEAFERIFQANLTVSDSFLTLDSLASIDVSKLLTDAANAVSSGSLRMTDYADITYFAEDYVGSTRTFS